MSAIFAEGSKKVLDHIDEREEKDLQRMLAEVRKDRQRRNEQSSLEAIRHEELMTAKANAAGVPLAAAPTSTRPSSSAAPPPNSAPAAMTNIMGAQQHINRIYQARKTGSAVAPGNSKAIYK